MTIIIISSSIIKNDHFVLALGKVMLWAAIYVT